LRPKWQNDIYRIIEKEYLQGVDGFIFNSKTTKSAVGDLIGNDKPSVVAYPPTDRLEDGITKSEIAERAKSDKFRIVFLGNVTFRKGLHTLLRAVKDLNLNIQVDVIGNMTSEPLYADDMETYVRTRDLKSCVTFHLSLDNEPLIDKLRNAHVLVVPSSYEGFGIVYLEGMGFGLPAIGTTAGAAGEIITHGEDGYLIGPDDANALAKHLNDLITDRELLLKMSLNAINRYQSQPKWDETAKSIREFLSVIAKGDSPEAISNTVTEISSSQGIASDGKAPSSQ
jgi:glycosyltransferase involved in cell wall biosynthesis